jgi:hypothetical protein
VADDEASPPGDLDPRVEPWSALAADALVAVARTALGAATAEVRDRAQVVLHITAASLAAPGPDAGPDRETDAGAGPGAAAGSDHGPDRGADAGADHGPDRGANAAPDPVADAGLCELEDGPALHPAVARRLACDAEVVALVEDRAGTPLGVGRRTRAVPAGLRRALRARDRGCRFPGCPEQRLVEAHHIVHWAHGGPTELANLVELCRFHHRLVHEGGWRIEGGAAEPRFVRPEGRRLAPLPPRAGPFDGDLAARNAAEGLAVTPDTIVSRWCGERLKLGYAVSVFMQPPRPERTPAIRAGPDG